MRAACFVGGSVVPVGGTPATSPRCGRAVGRQRAARVELVGEAPTSPRLWDALGPAWGPARSRALEPAAAGAGPADRASTPTRGVRPAVPADLDSLRAGGRGDVHRANSGVSPYAAGGEAAYRARVAGVVAAGRAFVRTDPAGRVLFKAEIGAVSRQTAQIQGVWVDPAFRGRGLGAAGVAAVVGARSAAGARRQPLRQRLQPRRPPLYARLGFAEVGTLATVLF